MKKAKLYSEKTAQGNNTNIGEKLLSRWDAGPCVYIMEIATTGAIKKKILPKKKPVKSSSHQNMFYKTNKKANSNALRHPMQRSEENNLNKCNEVSELKRKMMAESKASHKLPPRYKKVNSANLGKEEVKALPTSQARMGQNTSRKSFPSSLIKSATDSAGEAKYRTSNAHKPGVEKQDPQDKLFGKIPLCPLGKTVSC